MACKHVLPLMRAQRAGAIITISSVAAWEQYPNVAYKATKAGMIAFTQQVAIQNAESGVRANVILPELSTPRWRSIRAPAPAAKAGPRSPPPVTPACRCATNGHTVGRRERSALSRVRRSEFHYRHCVAGRWWRLSPHQLIRSPVINRVSSV